MKNFRLLPFLAIILALTGCSNSDTAVSGFENPTASNSEFPYLFSAGGELFMSWISHHPNENSYSLNYSRYSGENWGEVHTIAKDSSWFVNWADYPSIIANRQGPVAAHWLNKIPGGTYAYNVNISLKDSADGWTPPVTPHFDRTATEHGFASMIPWDDKTVLAVWLDGRQSANRADDEYYDLGKAMTLRGALISTSGEVKKSFLIDEAVCDCCPTSLIKTKNGAVVAYRNRTRDEIRDIYLSRFNGAGWSKPKAVYNDGWKIGACPVNGPKLATAGSTVVLAWHTAADENPVTKAAASTDNGATFGEPQIVSKKRSLGRVDAAVYDEKIFVSWMEGGEGETVLKLKQVDAQKPALEARTISKINGSRKTGFPQLEVLGDKLIMAWTDIDSSAPTIRTVEIPL